MSVANPLWGAPRTHGELLKLGIDLGQTTVAKYMVKRRRPPSQGWKTFLRNHADALHRWICLSTQRSRFLYGLVILRHSRRELLARIPSRCTAKLSERGRRDKTRSVQAIPAMDVHRTLTLSDDLMEFDEDLFQGRTVVPLVIVIL